MNRTGRRRRKGVVRFLVDLTRWDALAARQPVTAGFRLAATLQRFADQQITATFVGVPQQPEFESWRRTIQERHHWILPQDQSPALPTAGNRSPVALLRIHDRVERRSRRRTGEARSPAQEAPITSTFPGRQSWWDHWDPAYSAKRSLWRAYRKKSQESIEIHLHPWASSLAFQRRLGALLQRSRQLIDAGRFRCDIVDTQQQGVVGDRYWRPAA